MSKMSILSSGSSIYVQLFHFNGNENNLFIQLKLNYWTSTI